MDRELYIKLAAVTKFFRKENDLACKYQETETQMKELKEVFARRKTFDNPITFRFWAISIVLCIYGMAGAIFGLFGGELFAETPEILQSLVALAGASLLLVGLLRIFSVKRKKEKHEKKYQAIWDKEFQPQIDKKQADIDNIGEQMRNMWEKYGNLVAFLPEKYCNLQATAYMFMAVRDGRADTLKEAYNLYEEQLHRWKLEEAAYQAAEMQRMVAMAVDELNAQQVETNAHLSAIEQYEFMKYIHSNGN